MANFENRWRMFIGIMTESTRKKNQRWFHIYIPEFLPTKTGDITPEDAIQKVKLKNVLTNQTEELDFKITSTVYADYFGITSSLDVPTMNRNMQVLVFNYATTDKWYWMPLERDDSYKTFEHYRISCLDESVTNKVKKDQNNTAAVLATVGGETPTADNANLDQMLANSKDVMSGNIPGSSDNLDAIESGSGMSSGLSTIDKLIESGKSLLQNNAKLTTGSASLFDRMRELAYGESDLSDKNTGTMNNAASGTTPEKDDIESRDENVTDDNTYFIEIDTKYRKHIFLSTSSSDGEEFRYFMKFDAEAHTVEIWDNCVDGSQPNNTIKIESRPEPTMKGRITLQNASNNSIVMAGEDMMINVPRNLVINVGGDANFECKGNVSSKILKDFSGITNGNESTTTNGATNHTYVGDSQEIYKSNKEVVISGMHKETENARMITTHTSVTWAAQTAWSLNTNMLTIIANGTASFTFNLFNCLLNTFTVGVTGVTTIGSKELIMNMQNWVANAANVAGSAIGLIRKHRCGG